MFRHAAKHFCQISLGIVHIAQVNGIPPRDMLTHQPPFVAQAFNAGQRTGFVKYNLVIR